ncbi:DUF3553 domain-containing protein [Propionivibrio sp.]|uniref:DUF3553 domain-containing protein n=1 Tax=Propionivibrio sp. TaxID=2212460 RepID=UPI003BF00CFE
MNNLTQGDRVFHPNKKGWGLGKVLSVTPDNIDVFFVGTGSKRLSKSFVKLEIAEGAAAKHRLLDNLGEASQLGSADYVSLSMAIERFLAIYPDGFATPSFLKNEREANVRAHQFCIQLLGEKEISELIAEHRYQDVCDRARHVESMTNLLTKSEKTLLYAALDLPENQKIFAVGLADLLYGTDSEEYRFKLFVRVLDLLEINRWQYATLFGFIRFPLVKAFIKPTVIQNVTKALCWRINYKPEANWGSYAAVLRLYNHLRTSLVEEGLIPRDMIDVHSFIGSVGKK